MVDDFDENKKKKRKKKDREEDDFPSENYNDFIKYLAENFKKIMPEFEKFFRQFQDQIEKGNFDLDQFSDLNNFRIIKNNLPQKHKAATLSKSYPTKDILVDVIDCGDKIIIIADLPGLEKQDIKLNLKSKSVLISVHKKKILKRVSLPVKVDKDYISASYKNGVLEIKLTKLK
ncbi:MAG: Hsp20/alpha crystallin family protein [Candidatus Helarchaeota archaeon]|nr:Hsp20/alpha crystallin family protein [Candidatus Helarchaeota archaeon]